MNLFGGKIMKKALSLILALAMCLSLIPLAASQPAASAAGNNPWTGRWTQDGGDHTWDKVFWQDGNTVVGALMYGNHLHSFSGTLSGNVLTGTATKRPFGGGVGEETPISLTMSADGSTINGDAGLAQSLGLQPGDHIINMRKMVDYSDFSPNYDPSNRISFSGLWLFQPDHSNWGGTLIVQNGDRATVITYMGSILEGTVAGNVLTARNTTGSTSPYDSDYMLRLTMSADGTRVSYYDELSGKDLEWGIPDGVRLSRITYVPAGVTAPPPTPPTTPPAAGGISVLLDGSPMTFAVPPQIISGSTMVPMRAIFEALGATVNWEGSTRTITATRDDTRIVLRIGEMQATVDGVSNALNQAAVIIDGSTLVPLRFVSEALGANVDWNGTTRTVTITS